MRVDEQASEIAELFKSVVDLDPQDRQSFLEERCRSNPALRAEVESLLQIHDRAGKFMERSAIDLAAETFAYQGAFAAGEVLGDYEILSLIGKGGMGEVYLAQDRRLPRRVALKLVRRGMDAEDILRRFHHEQRLLATLNHPNIAQLYDAGVTADGAPFFAMEHVDGLRIDDYCRGEQLALKERLELFCKVCAAIHYAHQHLVVHRDIKPSNILVTAAGEPKLLDFGIAKLLESESDALEQTITLAGIMTPEYASPEHVRGEPITTVSDVYSLGVLLYDLLTGEKPYKLDSRTPIEIARVITEKEPTKPSAIPRESRIVNQESADPRFWCYDLRSLRGDLDNIVLMAMRKEPQRRYASVAQFSSDIHRYLNGFPVRARKDTLAYRSSKFARRHRAAVAAAVVVAAAIISGLAISIRQTQLARREEIKAEAVSNFLQEMLGAASPGATVRGRENARVKDVLDKASNDLASEKLSSEPEVKAQLLRVIGTCYLDLGQYHLAEQNLRSALQLQSRIYGENALETLKTLTLLAALWLEKGEIVKGDEFYAKTISVLRREQKKGRVSADYLMEALYNYGLTRRLLSDPKEGERLLREALSLRSQAPPSARALIDEVESVLTLTLCDQGKFQEAENILRAQLESFRHRAGAVSNAALPVVLGTLGLALMEQAKFAEAEHTLREAKAIYRKSHDPFYMPLGNDLRLLADVLYREGKYAEAESNINETLKIYRASSGPGYTNYPTALTIQGLIYAKTGRAAEAEKLLREAVELRSPLPNTHFMKAIAIGALGELLTDQNRFIEAEPLLLNSFESLTTSQIPNSPRLRTALLRLCTLYEKWNKPDVAITYRAKLH